MWLTGTGRTGGRTNGGEIDEHRLTRIVPSVSLAASAVAAAVAVAAITATSPGVREGGDGGAWSSAVALAATGWVVSIVLWTVAAQRPMADRPLAPSVGGALTALAPAAVLLLAVPAADHPVALGWLWIWSFALAAESVIHSIAGGRLTPEPITWFRDGCIVAAVSAGSFAFERIDVLLAASLVVSAVGLGWVFAAIIRAALRRHHHALASDRAEAEAEERRRRANWIHDELLSELRLARLRLETADGGTRQALAELIDIEHRLRMRQLDVELEAGGTRLAEIVQPFVRMIVGAGCRVDGVPSAEVAGTWIDATAGYELKRFFGVAVPNALLAGAALVVLDLELHLAPAGRRLVVRVRDDAGGFDPEQSPLGRGRDRLERELGAERLSTLVDAAGTTFSCEFELDLEPG